MKRIIAAIGGLALATGVLPATGQGSDAVAAYVSGDYQGALACLSGAPDADSHAFTARVLLSEAISTDGPPPPDLLQDALEEANLAIARQPGHVEGRLQKAIALSLIVRPMSLGEARKNGWGSEARDLAEAVLAEDPANAYAHGFLAVWNIEVLRRGGTLGAMMMGASLDQARDHYRAAADASPDDAAIHWQWGRVLASLNAKKYRAEIEAALGAAQAAGVDSDLERVMQARASTLKQVLETRGPKAAEATAADML